MWQAWWGPFRSALKKVPDYTVNVVVFCEFGILGLGLRN